jgi:hypothetical protein
MPSQRSQQRNSFAQRSGIFKSRKRVGNEAKQNRSLRSVDSTTTMPTVSIFRFLNTSYMSNERIRDISSLVSFGNCYRDAGEGFLAQTSKSRRLLDWVNVWVTQATLTKLGMTTFANNQGISDREEIEFTPRPTLLIDGEIHYLQCFQILAKCGLSLGMGFTGYDPHSWMTDHEFTAPF